MPIPACVFAEPNEMDISSIGMDSSVYSVFSIPEEDGDHRWTPQLPVCNRPCNKKKPKLPCRQRSFSQDDDDDGARISVSCRRQSAPSGRRQTRRQSITISDINEFLQDLDKDEEEDDGLVHRFNLSTVTEVSKDSSMPPTMPRRRSSVKKLVQ